MFFKTVLTFLAVGVLSVSAMTIPVARSPAPEPESQELVAWMLKRDLSYNMFSREPQALGELFSREPEDLAKWAGLARDYYIAKRERTPPPSPPPSPPPNWHLPAHLRTPTTTDGKSLQRTETVKPGPSDLKKVLTG